jgi:predicted kinase
MRNFRLVVITGLPGTGKTTLAQELARRHALPLICKDTIKEPLMEVLGSAASSRELSNASFAIMFALAREWLALGQSLILEGNFRAGEHESPFLAVLPSNAPAIVQVLCSADEQERRATLLRRSTDAGRHPGHRDAQQLAPVAACDSFLELPGERLRYRVGFESCETFSLQC